MGRSETGTLARLLGSPMQPVGHASLPGRAEERERISSRLRKCLRGG